LEKIPVPEFVQGRDVSEEDFSKILDWCETWIILFNAHATSEHASQDVGKFLANIWNGK
jgi:hypothetical protein